MDGLGGSSDDESEGRSDDDSVAEVEDLVRALVGDGGNMDGAGAVVASSSSGSSGSGSSSSSSTSSSGSSSSNSDGEEEEGIAEEGNVELLAPGPAVAHDRGGRVRHDHIMITANAKLTYFEHGDRKQFIMKCTAPNHKACIFSKTAVGNARRGAGGKGRPLGYLVACALAHEQSPGDFPDKATHKEYVPSLVARQAAREYFRSLPNSGFYFSKERPRDSDAGEPEEPREAPL